MPVFGKGVARFDPLAEQFAVEHEHVHWWALGCMEDDQGRLWTGSAVPPWSVHAIDTESLEHVEEILLPDSVKGISFDFFGYVWGVGGSAYRIDPDTGDFDVYDGLDGPYTYSDMTGFALSNAGSPAG